MPKPYGLYAIYVAAKGCFQISQIYLRILPNKSFMNKQLTCLNVSYVSHDPL